MNTMTSNFFSETNRHRWLWAALLCIFVGVSFQYTNKITTSERDNRSAFLRWRDQVHTLDDGVDIYRQYNYPNPPIMALLLYPLMKLPPIAGSLIWFYLKVVMALLAIHWAFRLVEQPGRPFPFWVKLLAIVLGIRPFLGDLTHNNVNIFIFFLIAAALMLFRRGRDLSAGILLGLAIACKVTPALFLPYFLWKRSWTLLAGSVIGLFLFWWVIPGLLLGGEYNIRLMDGWINQMVWPFVVEGNVTSEHQNQSLPGLLHRLLTASASFSTYNGDTYVPVEYHNLVNLNSRFVNFLLKACMGVFALLAVWLCRAPRMNRFDPRWAAEFSLILIGMLLFSERTWKHHCVTIIVPFAVVLYYAAVMGLRWRRRVFLGAMLALAVALMASTSTGLDSDASDRLAKLAQVYGAYVWAHLAVAAALLVILRTVPAPVGAALAPPHILSFRAHRDERLGRWVIEDFSSKSQPANSAAEEKPS